MTLKHYVDLTSLAGVVLLMMPTISSCSSQTHRAHVLTRVDETLRDLPDSPALRAEASRVEAGLAREKAVTTIDSVQLRLEDVSANAARRGGRGIDIEARLSLANPWAAASELRARQAQTDAAVADMEERALELRSDDCIGDIEAASSSERQALFTWFEERMVPLLHWIEACRAAGTMDELEAERSRLEGENSLESRRPRIVDLPREDGRTGMSLPPLTEVAVPLDLSQDTILELLDRHRPEIESMRATARAYGALSKRARRNRLPWFGFVGVSWEFDQEQTAGDLQGEVTVEVPFGLDLRAETSRFEALDRAEQHEADAFIHEAAVLAHEALERIAAFEGSIGRLSSLLESAAEAEIVADRWRTERLGRPRQVADLFEEIFDAREEAIDARERAGLAGCVLLETTGVSVADWPRQHRE